MENFVERYNQAERIGKSTVSNRAIEAFSPEVFNTIGYPSRIENESELWRYHDVMHEGRFDSNLKLLGKYSDHDFDLVTKTAKQILNFSEKNFKMHNSGKHALTRALYQFQLIMQKRPHDGQLSILEVGPGSGYLGLLLANEGHKYFAMDAAQAFYLYQKKLWSEIYGENYVDQSEFTESAVLLTEAKITHIPWWRFANLEIPLPQVDVVTINCALAEIHENAVKTIFSRLYNVWGDNQRKVVVAENLGFDYFNRKDKMFFDIRARCFTVSHPHKRVWYFRPDRENSIIESSEIKKMLEQPRLFKFTKPKLVVLIVALLRTSLGQRLAKVIGRGPLVTASAQTQPVAHFERLQNFFENLVPDERTKDEVFLDPRPTDIK